MAEGPESRIVVLKAGQELEMNADREIRHLNVDLGHFRIVGELGPGSRFKIVSQTTNPLRVSIPEVDAESRMDS